MLIASLSSLPATLTKELLGAQHNIVRHPDIPRAALNLAWNLI